MTKVPDYCIDEVSDHTMALLLAVVRKIPLVNAQVHAGTWKMPAVVPIHRLRGSVLGPHGLRPDSAARGAQGAGLRHEGDRVRPVRARRGVRQARASRASISPTLLKTSDYMSIHSPLMPETRGLFNADAFRQMKPTAYIINTARGPIVDEAALAEALDAKDVWRARRST